EPRDLHIEMFSVPGKVHHMVMAPHGAYGGGQQAAGTVGVGFSGGDHGLSSDDPFPVDGLHFLQGVENVPVPGGELNGLLAQVLNGDGVAEGVVHPVVLEKGALEAGLHRNLNPVCHFGHLTCHNLIIDENTSCKQNYQNKESQYGKDRIEKQKLAYGLEPSLSIKFSHGLVQIDPENQQKYSGAVDLEHQVQQQAYDEQDKQEGLIVEREDQMIGVGVVFPDVRQPNEKCEDRQEEKYDQGKFGEGGIHIAPRFVEHPADAMGPTVGHFVGPAVLDPVPGHGLVEGVEGVPVDPLVEEIDLLGEGVQRGFLLQFPKVGHGIRKFDGIPLAR